MEIAFKFISKYLYFSPKKKHFHKRFKIFITYRLNAKFLYYEVKNTYHVTNIPQIARVLKYIKDNIKKTTLK